MRPRRRVRRSDGLDAIHEDSESSVCTNDDMFTVDSGPSIPHHLEAKPDKRKQLVFFSRSIVIIVLLLSAVALSIPTYFVLSQDEQNDFESKFLFIAEELKHVSGSHLENMFTASMNLGSMYTSFAEASNQELPFVSLKDFHTFGSATAKMMRASLLAYSPNLETQEALNEWNQYSQNNTDMVFGNEAWLEDINATGPMAATNGIVPYVFRIDDNGTVPQTIENGRVSPVWQICPFDNHTKRLVNFDLARTTEVQELMEYTATSMQPILSAHTLREVEGISSSPESLLLQPIFSSLDEERNRTVVGHLFAMIPWEEFFSDVLQQGQEGIYIIIESCGRSSTFIVNGARAKYVGEGDLHETEYESFQETFELIDYEKLGFDVKQLYGHQKCLHKVRLYPTDTLKANFESKRPVTYAFVIGSIFVFSAVVFVIYDLLVVARQRSTEQKAQKNNAIVQELFPGKVATQLFEAEKKPRAARRGSMLGGGQAREYEGSDHNQELKTRTIAELYPAATVFFADIAGFTAWSSIRDPPQVFVLLEAVFQAFDGIAKQYGVFKVETIGDCYVAVCGVPTANKEHALTMARFARDALDRFNEIVRSDLELTLGPDTADLGLRVGLHSGPVTAGVLRADRARFQLFGDTVNTASRMESNGIRGRIHLSEQAAAEIIKSGFQDWIVPRKDKIEAKGKGQLQTYWMKLNSDKLVASTIASSEIDEGERNHQDTMLLKDLQESAKRRSRRNSQYAKTARRNERLIEWNTELLLQLLKGVVARRMALPTNKEDHRKVAKLARTIGERMIVDEVREIIEMPEYVPVEEIEEVELDEEVIAQVRAYVARIATMYNDNCFHNFEHASHVTMSVSKLLTRIVSPRLDEEELKKQIEGDKDKYMYDRTYGITADPLTQFACVFSALIHDVEHRGVPNFTLNNEDPKLAEMYKQKSTAEQNSVNVAWRELLNSKYDDFRYCIFGTEAELRRFRGILVNSVIATDIFDKDLSSQRKLKWENAFQNEELNEDGQASVNRKATIVIEHLIQASDVAHTMQHWHVYRKWNERLYAEMYAAHLAGRSDKDPTSGWYKGELWFYDNYIIPLAKKLRNCGVFGVASDEYLNYASQNRAEWALKGVGIMEEMKEKQRETDVRFAI